jgi:hypothetical protein
VILHIFKKINQKEGKTKKGGDMKKANLVRMSFSPNQFIQP